VNDKSKLVTDAEASEFLGVTVGTLAVWRCTGRYRLPFVKVGGLVRYIPQDLNDFVERRRCNAPESTKRRSRK
jgi:hypothetical protein